MLKRSLLIIAGLMVAGAAGPAMAQDYTGIWTGPVAAISEGQTKFHSEAGVRGTRVTVRERQGVESWTNDVTVTIDTHQGSVIAGSWSNGQAGFPFVCGVDNEGSIHCADETGYTTGRVSGSTMNFCFAQAGTGSSDGGKVAACGTLTKR